MNTQNKQEGFSPSLTTIRARTRRLLIDTAMSMYERGAFPSITEVASAAQLSRATAYRYFPTQSALVSAMVDESLGPILAWQPTQPDARQRIAELLSFAYPRMLQHEGVLRAERCTYRYSNGLMPATVTVITTAMTVITAAMKKS
ncbi:bacterial regulatory s, tetR family protein [Yersinia pseudotuberculosis]|nr:bacterial regulatory s, tetR family protein [Yersinia pseudotuberculosis]